MPPSPLEIQKSLFGGLLLRQKDTSLDTPRIKSPSPPQVSVVHLSPWDASGGAAAAAYRLHNGLVAKGVSSKLLVGQAITEDEHVDIVPSKSRVDELLGHLTTPLGLNNLNILSSFAIHKHPFFKNAGIVNFHNLHNDYFNYAAIYSLTKYKPAVLTLHDMWSFTGHCAFSSDCERWKTGCGRCPYPNTYPEIRKDNTHIEWKLKKWIYKNSNLTIVAPSRWIAEQARNSILGNLEIHHIPYGVDTEVYRPLDFGVARAKLGIPPEKYVLMFGAHYLTDARKGADLLAIALNNLPQSLRSKIVLITMGCEWEKVSSTFGVQSVNIGYCADQHKKAETYSAADIFVCPTRNDNLPLMLMESMACGTPMVSFDVGGVPDLVRPNITGYLAHLPDTDDFSRGIESLLEDKLLRAQMEKNCRAIALEEYALEMQAERYLSLYQELLHGNN